MSIIADNIERSVNRFLQQKIHFYVGGKLLKTGKLILFSIKDFHLVFTINIHHHKKTFEIPYPFDFESHDNRVVFSYNLQKFYHGVTCIEQHARLLAPKKPNKYYDSYAEITTVADAEPELNK